MEDMLKKEGKSQPVCIVRSSLCKYLGKISQLIVVSLISSPVSVSIHNGKTGSLIFVFRLIENVVFHVEQVEQHEKEWYDNECGLLVKQLNDANRRMLNYKTEKNRSEEKSEGYVNESRRTLARVY